MQYFVYIVLCSDETFYTGITNDLEKRILAHNGQNKAGAKYTRARRPVELYYSEIFSSKSDAMKREWQIKQLTREEKAKLMKKNGN